MYVTRICAPQTILMYTYTQVFGPILHEVSSPTSLNASMKGFYDSVVSCTELTLTIEAFQASWIDVRDIAEGLVQSLSKEEAGGKRFIVSKENFVWQDWCQCFFFRSILSKLT